MKAFPTSMNEGYPQIIQGGMDLRDWFAGLALPVIMPDNRAYPMDAAKAAYQFADAMMKERKKNETSKSSI